MLNNYINKINTRIVKRKFFEAKYHIVPADNILLDYKKLNIEKEEIMINDQKVDYIYDSSVGTVLVSNLKPISDKISISVNYENRYKILKSLTARLLIKSVLKKYFSLDCEKFYTRIEKSTFSINNLFFEKDVEQIISILEKNINEYIKNDVKIIKSNNRTTIPGIFSIEKNCITVSSLSEIRRFKIIDYTFNNNGVIISYGIE
ncbi:hypothetical protein ABGF49_03645 [Helcococcus ovis]|uniref:Uncharacterized protein n=1 Tax=Helcococcus ovis TaxID=72026 RepID=A0A4R9C3E4_9FIRM|nr:hypothetical protein [Helcococcus ovis]TFF65471.1 hypothetical protein EQF91_05655 [Helcococcus ovis]TFF65709.1 hypothetical protein EQF92_01450 [Helcococcus ovis]TFF68475.1 hypothetical protein EQF93_01865 [Helcococcus ovis]WNZ01466.1 hypothetical protein EQF90_001055 [Helcococcus ovis]